MRIQSLRLALACIVFALLACSHEPELRDQGGSEASRLGTVIISVSHDLVDATETTAYFFLDERTLGGIGLLSTPFRSNPGDFKARRGQVLVLQLAPGQHTIDRWKIETTINARRPKNAPPPLAFQVNAGEVIYIGNLHLQFRVEPGLFDAPVIRAAVPVVLDNAPEDIEIAEKRVPSLRGRTQVRLLPLGPWLAKPVDARPEAGASPYAALLSAAIRENIEFSREGLNDPALFANPSADVEVRVAPDGRIIGRHLVRSSGFRAWDEAVLKAIDLTGTLPLDRDGQVPPVLRIAFRPR